MKTEMKPIFNMKKNIFAMKMKLASQKKLPDWSIKDLDKALVKLKTNKSHTDSVALLESFRALKS